MWKELQRKMRNLLKIQARIKKGKVRRISKERVIIRVTISNSSRIRVKDKRTKASRSRTTTTITGTRRITKSKKR